MSTNAKIQHKGQVPIPTRLRQRAGLSKGNVVEFSFSRGKIVITPKIAVDPSHFTDAGDDYTPAQRKIIDASLAKSEAEFAAGRTHGPFNTAADAIDFLRKEIKARTSNQESP